MCDRSANKPSDELVVTPEMIQEGAVVIWESFYDVLAFGSETGREVAKSVYLAMANAQK
jgi:hypothetical protein